MKALIIGGGVAGPVTALALQGAGIDATIYESRPRTDGDVGSYFTVTANGLTALDAVGALGVAREAGFPTRRNVLWNHAGRRLASIPLDSTLRGSPAALTMKRSKLARLLQDEALGRLIRIEFGRRLSDASVTADGRVTAKFDDGTTASGDLLIGADGVHSVVRSIIDPKAPLGRYVGLTNFGGFTRGAAHDIEPEAWHMIFGRRAFFGYQATPAGDVVWFANVPRPKISPSERDATARAAQADVAPDDVERAALTELGDPGLLAARYAAGPHYLIGPVVYLEWRRLVTMLVSILVPIIVAAVLSASLLSGSTIGSAIVAAGVSAFQVALQAVFWITLVMALIERAAGSDLTPRSWTPDALPKVPDDGRIGLMEVGAMLVFDILVIAGLLWVQLFPPITIDGVAYPLFDPALWSFWLPWFIAVMLLEIGFAILLVKRGRWTWTLAVLNAVLGAAFGIPLVYLISNGLLLNPALLAAIGSTTDSDWVRVTTLVVGVVAIVTVIADAADGFMKAWRASLAGAGTVRAD